ncbi:MAG: hypothetical protein VW715_15780 [Rhodospirillales bacterium]|jgi:hypothetical protein
MSETIIYQLFERVGLTDNWIAVDAAESEEEALKLRSKHRGLSSKEYRVQQLIITQPVEE